MSITLWKPEHDLVLHQALGKVAEEANELAKIATRCMIQGYHEAEPVTEKANSLALREEVADVKAAIRWLFEVLDQSYKGESPRERRKFDGFREWQAMLEADGADQSAQAVAPAEKYRNSVDGKTYEIMSESEGLVTFRREGRDTPIHLGSAEFYKRYQAIPIPAPAENGDQL